MIRESRLHPPDPDRARTTNSGSPAAFQQLLRRSREQPEKFWADVASELEWIRPWDTVAEGGFPHFRFFVGGITNPTINMLDRHLARGADNRLALVWEGEEGESRFFTYRMLAVEVNRCANVLKALGVRKGDAVAIFTPNLAETIVAVLACYRLGALFNTVFSGFSTRALRDRLAGYGPKVVITADGAVRRGQHLDLKRKVDEALDGLDGVEAVIVIRRTGDSVPLTGGRDRWWHDLMRSASPECEPEPLEANEPGIVFYTSGTTGKPKGIVHSGNAFVINNYVYTKYHLDHHPHDVLWCTADIGWLTMHIWGIAGALANGLTTVVYDGALDFPGPDRFYRIMEKYRVNKLFTAPTAIRMLMRHGEGLASAHDLSCLEVVGVVGEPFNPEAWHWTRETLGRGRVEVNNTWGQTELAGCPLAGAAWLTAMKPGSCGTEFLGASLDVVDDEGRPVPSYVTGHLVIRRPFPMMLRTLWKEPDRYLREYFSQVPGCYFTHDAAVKDEDGHFWVIGRIDDVINVAGHRLSTMEMESAILECPEAAEAAVVGAPDAIKGTVPVAFVTLRTGVEPSDALRGTLRDQVARTIGKIAVPERIYLTEVLPKTASGKIMRRLLKELVEDGQVRSDVTGLEDVSALERVRALVLGS
jgi:acetyl-CoA synthetase